MAKDAAKKPEKSSRIVNRKARHEYAVIEAIECGLELVGSEVKSIRDGQMKIDEAFVTLRGGQAYLVGATIAHYAQGGPVQHEINRDRRLLLHRREMPKLHAHTRQKGKTIIPLAVYFKRGWAKCEIALAVGKKQFDKREAIKQREITRDIQRELGRRRRR